LESKAIIGGRLIDGTGKSPLENSVILINGSRIDSVGLAGEVKVPEDAKIVDATGKTVMPGMIDSHLHFFGFRTDEWITENVVQPPELGLIRSVFDAENLLKAGFTTVKDCGGTNALYLKKAVEEGVIRGPRILAAGYILSQTFGHGDIHYFPMEWVDARVTKRGYTLICDGVPECIKAARYALRQGADFIKVCTTGGVLSMRDPPENTQFTLEEIRAIVEEARHARTFVTSHSEGREGIGNSVLGGVKTIDHAWYPDKESIEMAVEKDVIFVPTLSYDFQIIEKGQEVGYPAWAVSREEESWEKVTVNIRRAHKAGVTMAAATDFVGSPISKHGTNAMELELLVKYCSFTPMEALVAMTANGAKACGMGDEIGTIESGKAADIILVDGDPLKDIRIMQNAENIGMVMKDGKTEVARGL